MHKNPLIRHSFLFGALIGGALILAALTFYWKGVSINYNPNLTTINHFLIITGIFFGVKKYRDEVLFGSITYKRALSAGVLTIGFAAMFYALFIYILTKFFDYSIIEETIKFTKKGLLEAGYQDDQVDFIMSIYDKITPGIFAFSHWFNKALGGLFFSLILAFFFRQNRNLFNNRSIDKFNQSNKQ